MEKKTKICIVGAGLVGSLLSILLAKRGIAIDIIEKRPDMRLHDIPGGRTIAMSLSDRGWKALSKVDLMPEVYQNTVPKYARNIHTSGKSIIQEYGKSRQAIYTINRKYINCTLMNKADSYPWVNFFFNHRCTHVDYDSGEITICNMLNKDIEKRTYDHIIAADGIFSEIAQNLIQLTGGDYQRFSPQLGYKELIMGPNSSGDWPMKNNFVHVWPLQHANLVALPNIDKTFICSFFIKYNDEYSMESLENETTVRRFFQDNLKEVIPYMPDYFDQFSANPLSNIYTVKCSKWNYKDKVLLIGDACHAIAPFFAMGMNVGFEDCTIFDQLMDKYDNDLSRVIETFAQERKADTDAIADISLDNFKTLSHGLDLRTHLHWKLNRLFWEYEPEEWMPLYPMVAFSHIGFADVKKRNEIQHEIVNEILNNENIEELNALQNPSQLFDKYVREVSVW